MTIKTPRCKICLNVEYHNTVNFGYIIGNNIHYERVKMCKGCESKQMKVGEEKWGTPIYGENLIK